MLRRSLERHLNDTNRALATHRDWLANSAQQGESGPMATKAEFTGLANGRLSGSGQSPRPGYVADASDYRRWQPVGEPDRRLRPV